MSTSSQPYDTTIPQAAVPAQSPNPPVTPEIYAEVARLGLGDDFPAAVALTRELFGDFAIRISVDPEISNCSYVTFYVHTADSPESIVQRQSDWFRRIHWPTDAEGGFSLIAIFDE